MARFKGIFQKVSSLSWTTLFSGVSSFAMRFLLISLFLFLMVVIYRGLNQTGYALQPFEMPKSISDNGINGNVA
tara:strand:+ start:378 stop:599 length:222 start_codon:yes stop_codon:yes gene_type:complete